MKIYKVGGAVRDRLMGKIPNDNDYVVVGSTIDEMVSLGYTQVGKDFPVFLDKNGNEYALARTERKSGDKHTDFTFDFNKEITLEEDVLRRDFTCNALAEDVNENIIDYVGGVKDIQDKVLRVVRPETFVEDPLRVLRMCRFRAQLGFDVDLPTYRLCQQMVKDSMLKHLSPERIWKEFEKALNTDRFDLFISTMFEIGALKEILPEIDKLFYTPENINHHPCGNTGTHTLLSIRKGYEFGLKPKEIFALLLHDVGKIMTPTDMLPKHHGHDDAGVQIIEKICKRLRVPSEYKDFAILCSKLHMKVKRVMEMRIGSVYDLVNDVTHFKDFSKLYNVFMVSISDTYGRDKEVSEKNKQHLNDGLNLCIQMYDTLKNISADYFSGLNCFKGKEFGDMLRVKKIQYFLDNKKPS